MADESEETQTSIDLTEIESIVEDSTLTATNSQIEIDDIDKASVANTINLGTSAASEQSEEDSVINLEGRPEEFSKETNVFDESDSKPASETPVEEETVTQAAVEVSEKPVVNVRLSNDKTGEIQAQIITEEETNIEAIGHHIENTDVDASPENIFGHSRHSLGPVVSISSKSSDAEEEEDRDGSIATYLAELGIQITKEPINRENYEKEFVALRDEALKLRRKNGLLNKKVSEYYRKRKMNRVFEESNMDMFETLLDRYEEKINDYIDFQTKTFREKEAVDNEIKDMFNLRDEQLAELGKSFQDMQAREREIGHGLIDSNNGKPIPDKVVEKLLLRQVVKSNEIASIRLDFIKRRDKVKEIENKIKALETIGGTLHLMDFEQLRMENQTFSDKIEERDEELMRLRDRYSHAMQALAHIREKINIMEVQIEDLLDKKAYEEGQVSVCREILNGLKIKRDANRAQKEKLKASTGILTYPKLLQDMEIGIEKVEQLQKKMDILKETNENNGIKLANIRRAMERTEHILARRTPRKVKSRVSLSRRRTRYYLKRPTLTYPLVPKVNMLKTRKTHLKLDEIK